MGWNKSTHPWSSQNRSADSEKGAALIEMAFVFPLLILLLIGIMELGGAFKDYLTTSDAVRQGTRLLSAQGTAETADCAALQQALSAMSVATDLDKIKRVEIYKANANGDQIPAKTNTYTHDAGDITDCANWTVNPDPASYPPGTRQVLAGAQPLDLVGMRIVFEHDWFTGFPPFTGSFDIDSSNIARLEPDGIG